MQNVIDHDEWRYAPVTLPRASALKLGEIDNVLPFDGVRNPSARSSISHKVHLIYRTAADGYRPRVGIAESAAEAAVAHELLISGKLYDLKFQPLTVKYKNEDGQSRKYTHDLLAISEDGHGPRGAGLMPAGSRI